MLNRVWAFCDPVNCSLPGSSVHEISQTRIVECIAISVSRRSCQPREPWQADSLPLSHLGSILYQIRENDQYILWIIHSNHPPNKEFLSFFLFFFLVFQNSSVQLLSHVRFFVTPWTAARQASLSITNSQSLLKLISVESVMPSNHLILVIPFSSCLEYFLASGSFPMSQFFASAGQSIGASTSVLPMNIQDWFPLGLTGLISLQP